MQRLLWAFIFAVLLHALLLRADMNGLLSRKSIAPRVQVITMQLVEREPYHPPAIQSLPAPPPSLPQPRPQAIVKEPAVKKPVVKASPKIPKPKPKIAKPSKKRLSAPPVPQPASMPAPAESESEPSARRSIAAPVRSADELPFSPPDSDLPSTREVTKATKGKKLPAAAAVILATPRYNENPPPVYPSIARKRGYQGTVMIEVFVKKDGWVGDLRVVESSGHGLLDRSAIDAVKHWQFEPGMQGDDIVAMWVRVPIHFRLQ
jgi:periplasmic protein TonB